MTGKLFDASTPGRKTSSREAVEAAIERAKAGEHGGSWDAPNKQSPIRHWEAEDRDPNSN